MDVHLLPEWSLVDTEFQIVQRNIMIGINDSAHAQAEDIIQGSSWGYG
jgi:hypothetical protein